MSSPEKPEAIEQGMLAFPPNALTRWSEIAAGLKGKAVSVFLDYDGTLTPIVDDPSRAMLSPETRDTLRRLAGRFPTAIVSGRSLGEVRALVGLDGLAYGGSHGFETDSFDGRTTLRMGSELIPSLRDAAEQLQIAIAGIAGARVEEKPLSIALHYRLTDEKGRRDAGEAFDAVARSFPQLKRSSGKEVLELRPDVRWDKGEAVRWLLQQRNDPRATVVPIYIGDDTTDEDAFRALAGTGITAAVGNDARPTSARYSLGDPEEVRAFLDRIVEL